MDDIIKDFLSESNENLDRLDQELVKLESDPSDSDLVASIFRTIHTIKGTCGFLGFARLERLTHASENLLSPLRNSALTLNSEITSALLAMVDAIRRMLGEIQATGRDGDENYESLIERLFQLQHERTGETPSPAHVTAIILPQLEGPELAPETSTAQPVSEDVPIPAAIPSARSPEFATIRVGVHLLDQLMNLVSELVLARNQLLQFSGTSEDLVFQALSQHMNLITSKLQDEVMRTRMQPISNLWSKFPRIVRDLALQADKQVRIEIDGQQTELDRTILEAIRDPLTHLVRNAIDHGIETAAKRVKAGKNPVGCLRLLAFHANGEVNIEISDDGAGLNLERIRQKAIERGLLTPAQAAKMPVRDVINLIFLPGFSSAEEISTVSGRSVGLDVVKTNVEKMGGAVEVQSTAGTGTAVKIRIPLTLAIMPALIVGCRGERFAIPQASMIELVSLENGAGQDIEMLHRAPVYRLRSRLLPVLYLSRELDFACQLEKDVCTAEASVNLVVLQTDGCEFGLMVDEIIDTQEIVVKPLSKQLKRVGVYSGATIMGDGRVALILDVRGLAERAHLLTHLADSSGLQDDETPASRQTAPEPQSLLVVECGNHPRMALPISQVARLEEFSPSAIEFAGSQEVMQYRGQIMPLVRLSHLIAGIAAEDRDESLHVVVCVDAGRSVGLVVDRIVDIACEPPIVEKTTQRRGVLGSALVQQKVTELLDLPTLVRELIRAPAEARVGG